MRTGVAELPLHYGRCPKWLFGRMTRLARAITEAIIHEFSVEEFMRRISDPFWFQAFGCVLGFDWHSSGLTTTVLGAMKSTIIPEETGIAIAGGKGVASRNAREEIEDASECFSLSSAKAERMVHASRIAAKVDTAAVQDSYNLYHHSFIFTEKGEWCVVQQGMNPDNRYARRYHWLSLNIKSMLDEPHEGIAAQRRESNVLDMTARKSREARKASLDAVKEGPWRIRRLLAGQTLLTDFYCHRTPYLRMPRQHRIIRMDKINMKTLQRAYEVQPRDYEELLSVKGMGAKSIRALALISELVYGEPASWEDPARFSFAHGGKDGIPYPVDRETYSSSINMLRTGVEQARIGNREALKALRRLEGFFKAV